MARVYPQHELANILSNLQIAAAITYAVAPCSPVLFRNIDITLFGIRINQYNCVALVMFIILVIFGFVTFFFLSNLTKHPGYKIYVYKRNEERETHKNFNKMRVSYNKVDENELYSITDIVTDFGLLVVMLSYGLIGFIYCLGEITINLVAMLEFKWTLTRVSIVTLFCAFTATVSMKLLQRLKGTVNTFFLFMLSGIFNWLFMTLLLFTLNVRVDNLPWQIFIFFTFLMLNIVGGFNATAWASGICFSIVPAHSSSTVDSVRYSIGKIGCSLGFFLASLAYSNSSIAYPIIAVLCILGYISLLVSHKRFV